MLKRRSTASTTRSDSPYASHDATGSCSGLREEKSQRGPSRVRSTTELMKREISGSPSPLCKSSTTISVSSGRMCVATHAARSRPGSSESRAPSSAVASERRSAGTTPSSASAKPRTNGSSVDASGGTSYTTDEGTVSRNWRTATDLPKPAGAMIVAMRYWAAVASRSRTRGRSIGRKTPPRSGRPSALTLRITSRKPTPRAQDTPGGPGHTPGARVESWPSYQCSAARRG